MHVLCSVQLKGGIFMYKRRTTTSVFALLLVLIMLFTTACSIFQQPGGPTEPTEPTEPPENTEYVSSAYVEKYADYEALDAWMEQNIRGTNVPPVTFNVNGQPSTYLGWSKVEGEWEEIVDFPTEDDPALRKVKEISYICEDKKLQVVVSLTVYPGYPVVEWDANLYNIGNGNSQLITNLLVFNHVIEANAGVKYLHANRGSTISYTDYEPLEMRLADEEITFEVTSGRGSTSTYLPFFNVENKENNTGTIAILSWQGQWRAAFSPDTEGVKLQAGQYETALRLQKGETMRYPGAVLLFYKGDFSNGQNVYRRWLYHCNQFREQGSRMRQRNAVAASAYVTESKDLEALELYKKTDLTDLLDKYNLDIGWHENWRVGNWYTNNSYTDGKLTTLADAVHKAGLQLAVWYEPERVQVGTTSARELKDIPNGLIAVDGNGNYVSNIDILEKDTSMLVNYAEPAALQYMIETITASLKENGVDQYRQDFNIDPQPFWKAQDSAYEKQLGIERVGWTENHHCTGYLAMYDAILEACPGMYIDACASGGQRNDLATIRYSFFHTRSDYWQDIESAQVQTYGSSMWFMYWGTGFSSSDYNAYDVRSHIGNSIGVCLTDESLAPALTTALEDWERIGRYLFYDYYPLTQYPNASKKTAALQYDSPEKGNGIIITYFRKDDTVLIKPRGLDPAASYRIWEEAFEKTDKESVKEATLRTVTGQELMDGFEVSSGAKTSVLFLYELVEGSDTTAFQNAFVPTGPGSNGFDPDAIVEDGKEMNNVTPPTVNAVYKANGMTDAELIEAWNASNISGDNMVSYIGTDYRSTGTIYAISADIYNGMPKLGVKVKDWEAIDKSASGFTLPDGATYYWTVYNNWYWEMQPFVRKIDDCYFLWFSNIVGLADSDGAWTDQPEFTLWWINGGEKQSATMHWKCENLQRIHLDGVDTIDGAGKIYQIDEAMFGSFVFTGNGIYMNDMLWYEMDLTKLGIVSVFQKAPAEGLDLTSPEYLKKLSDIPSRKLKVYASVNEDGQYYLWMREVNDYPWFVDERMSPVGRSLFVWYNNNGELCMQTMVHR